MSEPKVLHTAYLGDGLYASFDGYQVSLSANAHDRAHGATDVVYLDPGVIRAFLQWWEALQDAAQAAEENDDGETDE